MSESTLISILFLLLVLFFSTLVMDAPQWVVGTILLTYVCWGVYTLFNLRHYL